MTSEEKQELAAHMATLDRHEREKLLKRASHLRKGSKHRPEARRTSPATHSIYSDAEDGEIMEARRKPSSGLEEYVWRIVQSERVDQSAPTGRCGLVIAINRRSARVMVENQVVDCEVDKDLAARADGLAVGDDAIVQDRGGNPIVVAVKPRRTKLSRPDVGNANRERVIAANIDTVVVVTSVVSPPLHPRIIDRYLVAIQRGGCRAAIAVNKLDLLSGDDGERELAKLAPYAALGVKVLPCIAHERKGTEELRECLTGELAAFVGHSGVGKSSLINALKPDLNLRVGEVSERYGRGTHTTTSSTLLDLGEVRVIDTPGIRSFGLWQLTKEDLPWYFPEFAGVGQCKFSDCTHTHEPSCRVKEAVAEGVIQAARYDNYLRLLESL